MGAGKETNSSKPDIFTVFTEQKAFGSQAVVRYINRNYASNATDLVNNNVHLSLTDEIYSVSV